jgi:hypothetical protein
MTTLETLTPKSPRWAQFITKLDQAVELLGCGGDGTQIDDTWKILPLNLDWPTLALTKRIMDLMKDVDIDASVAFFREHGGFCDCEIVMNVDPD